jgi:hypothetical protein
VDQINPDDQNCFDEAVVKRSFTHKRLPKHAEARTISTESHHSLAQHVCHLDGSRMLASSEDSIVVNNLVSCDFRGNLSPLLLGIDSVNLGGVLRREAPGHVQTCSDGNPSFSWPDF